VEETDSIQEGQPLYQDMHHQEEKLGQLLQKEQGKEDKEATNWQEKYLNIAVIP